MRLFSQLKKYSLATTFFWLLFLFLGFYNGNTYATAPTLTLNITNSTVSLDIVPSSTNGTFASSSSDISFTVNTNNYTGYTLGITASSNDANAASLTHSITEGGNTTTYAISSIGTVSGVTSSGITESTFSTSSNTQYNNTWGMKPSKLNSSSNSNYLPAPTSTSNTITIDTTTAANTNNVANSYTIGIGARIDNDLPPGAYTNTFVVTAVARALTYSITYNANDGNNGNDTTDMPQINPVTSVVNPNASPNYTITLASAPSRDGYNFLGWCTTQVADGAACSGTEYQAGGSYEINYTSSNVFTLYARWEEIPKPKLYDLVAAMSKGTQDITALRAAIVAPDETNTISSNSGVYEYNGADSDGVNSNNEKETIYYYRGILDSYGHTGTYGSDGLADAYPNYVILQAGSSKATTDTCWRIVRTTGSGGVKMIYNGKWTGSTCANSSTRANAVSNIYFNRGTTSSTNNYETKGRITYVGYNYNQDYGYGGSGQSESGSIANSTLFSNGTSSYIKTRVESWYTSNLTAYTSILETSAGYCNDRTTYTGDTTDTLTDSTVPYKTSSATVNFGAYIRNTTTSSQPSLNCPNTTGHDLLTTSNGLNYPVALITADEAALAGSGNSARTTPYHANSYLRSGDHFWLLSPYYRGSSGDVREFYLYSSGHFSYGNVSDAHGVRPVISLKSGTTATSGSGTATDPWVVTAPVLINFTISGVAYQAEEGMTWEEWVSSSYNTSDFTVSDSSIQKTSTHARIIISASDLCSSSVYPSATIIEGNAYGLRDPGPC